MKKLLLILLCSPMIGFGQERVHICDLDRYTNRGSKFYQDPYRVNYQKLCNFNGLLKEYWSKSYFEDIESVKKLKNDSQKSLLDGLETNIVNTWDMV